MNKFYDTILIILNLWLLCGAVAMILILSVFYVDMRNPLEIAIDDHREVNNTDPAFDQYRIKALEKVCNLIEEHPEWITEDMSAYVTTCQFI